MCNTVYTRQPQGFRTSCSRELSAVVIIEVLDWQATIL
jgi:hypothetical protein